MRARKVNFSGMNKAGLNRPPLPEPQRGAMELKLSWKELGKGDILERFLHVKAMIEDANGVWQVKDMGLVGMHVAVKTRILAHLGVGDIRACGQCADQRSSGRARQPPSGAEGSFLQRSQPADQTRQRAAHADRDRCFRHSTWDMSKVTYPVQVTRVIPIPVAKEILNSEVQGILGKAGSVLQYYELIDTQWPTGTDPKTGTAPLTPAVTPGTPINYNAPNAVANKVPGDLTPTFLTNSTMETYFQKGNQPATGQEEGSSFDTTPVFATESCTGCHYSAGIVIRSFKDGSNANQAIFGGAGNGDFSWLMAQKAQWRK